MFNDAEASLAHLKGVQEIIRRRGVEILEKNLILRKMLFWYVKILFSKVLGT